MNRIESQARPSVWSLFAESMFAKRLAYASATFLVLVGVVFVSASEPDEPLAASDPHMILAGDQQYTPVTMDDVSMTWSATVKWCWPIWPRIRNIGNDAGALAKSQHSLHSAVCVSRRRCDRGRHDALGFPPEKHKPRLAWNEAGREFSLQKFKKELDLSDSQTEEFGRIIDDFMSYYQVAQAQMEDVRATGKSRILKHPSMRIKKRSSRR